VAAGRPFHFELYLKDRWNDLSNPRIFLGVYLFNHSTIIINWSIGQDGFHYVQSALGLSVT